MNYSELTVLIPSHSLEDFPMELAEKPAASLLNAFAVAWHPALLASAEKIFRWARADDPPSAPEGSLFLIPIACDDMLPNGWVTLARQAGSTVVSGEHTRDEMIRQALLPLELQEDQIPDADLTADFLALGAIYLHLELLTRRMRNYSNFDEHRLKQEAVAAARCAMDHDPDAARKHLRICFEMLQESRERFYPVECFLLDLCLTTPETWPTDDAKLPGQRVPINLLAPAQSWQTILQNRPEQRQQIQEAVKQQLIDFLGGDDVDQITSLMSLDAMVWHLQQGRSILQELVHQTPTIWARRRYGIHTQLPQILKRLGYQGALHTLLDDGLAPDEEQSQIRWDGCDGSTIDAFSRIPLPADSARNMLRFSERMAESMDYDHVATVVFARWPVLRLPHLEDFHRAHTYAPVLGQFVRFTEYFAQSSVPGRRSEFKPSQYLSPALSQSVAMENSNPVSRYLDYWQRERRFVRAEWVGGINDIVFGSSASGESSRQLEQIVRAAAPEATSEISKIADDAVDETFSRSINELRKNLTAGGEPGHGVLVVNTLSFPRKVVIEWPGTGGPPRDPSILGVQVDDERILVLISLPPCGFVWLPSQSTRPPKSTVGKTSLAEELLLRNDRFEVRLSETTGGIAQIHTYHRSPNRLSQQISLRFPHEKAISFGEGEERETYTTFYTSMRLRETRVLSRGPLMGEIVTQGDLIDDHRGDSVGTFRQWTRLVHGRGTIEVDVEISPAENVQGDPWTNYIGCRFAWKHETVALTASYQQGAHAATKERIEAPQFIEIADDDFRTTILSPGLMFHRKTGERMLDTLLLTKGETRRHFQFAIAIDNPYPMQAHLDQYTPPVVIETSTRPQDGKREGWFFYISASNVQLHRILPGSTSGKILLRLIETEGRRRVLGLHCFKTPQSARQIDFQGKTVMTLKIDDAVNVEIGAFEICDIELQM